MGRFMRDLRDAFRRQSAEESPSDDPPEQDAAPLGAPTQNPPDVNATLSLPNDESKPTLMVKGTRAGLEDLVGSRYTSDSEIVDGFTIVPDQMVGIAPTPEKPHWRVELAFDDFTKLPIRVQVADAAVIGRGRTSHINLDAHEAELKGVSRKHAMLRPSSRALFFFDLESKNGTHHNGIPMGPGMAMTLTLGDVIRLGSMNLTVRKIERIA